MYTTPFGNHLDHFADLDQRTSSGTSAYLSASSRYPRWNASEACHRNDRPSRPVDGRPCACRNRPCGGHSKGQGLSGRQSHSVGHRTLQAFYRYPPSGEAETWGDDHRLHCGEEATWSVPDDNRGRPCSGLPYDGHRGSDHPESNGRPESSDHRDDRHGEAHGGHQDRAGRHKVSMNSGREQLQLTSRSRATRTG